MKELLLRDGTPAMIWSLSPNDGQGLQENYKGLSAQSRYNRFLTTVGNLSDSMLRRLVDDVDGLDHQALVLLAFPGDEPEVAAGLGRMVRYQNDPQTADVAITVKDAWQGRGVASALLAELIAARPEGVRRVLTYVAASNAASLAMLDRLGEMTTSEAGPNILEVRVELSSPWPGQK